MRVGLAIQQAIVNNVAICFNAERPHQNKQRHWLAHIGHNDDNLIVGECRARCHYFDGQGAHRLRSIFRH